MSDPKIGDFFYMKNDPRKYHVVSILDKEDKPQIVYKYFGVHKQWWHYEIDSVYNYNQSLEIGLYFKKGKR